jgi:hypothetical protein
MPIAKIAYRAKKAKAKGTPVAVFEAEVGRPDRGSNHSLKKSRHVAGPATSRDRTVSPRRPPGEGRNRRRAIKDLREAWRAENAASGGGRGRSVKRSEPHARPVSRVQGRKKAPSRMNIKSKGGPRSRLPIHGD